MELKTDADADSKSAAAFALIVKRLGAVESELTKLREVITEPDLPRGIPKGIRRAVFKGTPESARKMRVAKAAKRNGMSVDAWVLKHGQREHNPPA